MLGSNFESKIELLKLYFPDYEVTFDNNIFVNHKDRKITIPNNFSNLEENVFLGLLFFLMNKKNPEINIENDNLSDLEKQQLSKVFSYLEIYNNIKESTLLDKKWKIKKFLEFLWKKITAKWPLWEFMKNVLQNIDDFENFDKDQFLQEYLDFKWRYLESQSCKNCNIDNNIEDETWYYEHEWDENLEQMEWEDMWVIWYLHPAINKSYFVKSVLEKWNSKIWQFNQIATEKEELFPNPYPEILTIYNWQAKKWKQYVLPLSKDLQPVAWDKNQIDVFKDSYGRYFFEAKQDGKFEIYIWEKKEQEQFFDEESVNETIYSWNNIDLSKFDDWRKLRDFIKSKKYRNVSQKWFKQGNDWNKYIENLFNADEMDCLPANVLFTILARSLWYQTRLVIGYIPYKKDEKVYISTNQWHAWSEIFVDGKWKRVDATPINTDEEEQNEEWDIENMVEQIWEPDWSEKQDKDNSQDQESSETSDKEEKVVDFEIDHTKHNLKEILSLSNIESKYFESALKYVYNDAMDIVNYINKILKQRKEKLNKQFIKRNKRKKRWLPQWKLKINPKTISKIAVWDTNIFEKNTNPKDISNEDIDTLLKDISIAIDVSGSMGSLTWNWENGTKLDQAYLSVMLLYIVSKELEINFPKVITFSNEVWIFTPEEALQKLEQIWQWWNTQNANGINKALESIEATKKWVVFILSDGDGATGQEFFDDDSKKIIKKNKNLFVCWFGIGGDATSKLENKIKWWKIPTVIEYRMDEAETDRAKAYNVWNYRNLVPEMRELILKLMTEEKVSL